MRESRPRTGQAVLNDLAQGRFEKVYLLIGDDSALAEEVISRLKARLTSPGLEPFDFESLHADELEVEAIRGLLRQPPVGSARRFVVIRNLTHPGKDGPRFSGLGKAWVERLLAELALTPDSTTVAVTGIEHAELAKIARAAGLSAAVIELRPPGPGELLKLMKSWAHEKDLRLEPDAARLLVEVSGEDTAVLKGEVEKLGTCFEPGHLVTAAEIRELAAASREFSLKEYVVRVLNRDVPGALAVLRRLEVWGENTYGIIIALTNGLIGLVARTGGQVKDSANGHFPWRKTVDVNRSLQQLYQVSRALLCNRPEPFARLELFTRCIGCGTAADYCDLDKDDRKWVQCLRASRGAGRK